MGLPQPTRYPVTLFHVDKLYEASCAILPPRHQVNMIAAITTAFALLLGVSEYTFKGALKPQLHAQRADIKFIPNMENPSSAEFTIKVSKTDQWRQAVTLTAHRNYRHPNRCPVTALQRLFITDPQDPTTPLFNFAPDGATRNSTRERFTFMCNQLFSYAGVDSMYLKTHRFR